MAATERWRRRIALRALLALLLATASTGVASPLDRVGPGSKNARAEAGLNRMVEDPLGFRDSFAELSGAEQEVWAWMPAGTTEDKMKLISQPLNVSVAVELKLVGFEEGSLRWIKESQFEPYLEALKADVRTRTLDGLEMPIHTSFYFEVSKSSKRLAEAISKAVSDSVEAASATPEGEIVSIPHSVVDTLVRDEYTKSELSYTIYVLAPQKPRRDYAYHFEAPGVRSRCDSTVFVGAERYVWIDLTAGPVSYGPYMRGEGLVTDTTLPRAPAGDDSDSAVLEIVGVVQRACRHLLSPSLAHPYVRTDPRVHVAVLRITDLPTSSPAGPSGVPADLMKQELSAALGATHQELRVSVTQLSFGDCPLCTVAFSRARRSHSSQRALGSFHGHLDSTELHHWLRVFMGRILHENHLGPDTVPVVLFDLATEELLLFDRTEQAVSFEDMVVAVRTMAGEVPGGFVCDGKRVLLAPHELQRPLIAGILRTVWAVPPEHLAWGEAQGAPLPDYLWSTSLTPFGPFGGSSALSFAQRDAVSRNVIFAALNHTVFFTRELVKTALEVGAEDGGVLDQAGLRTFTQRWNVLVHKLRHATHAVSVHDFPGALYYAVSATHDLDAMQDVLKEAMRDLRTELECFSDPAFSLAGAAGAATALGALAAAAVAVYVLRAALNRARPSRFSTFSKRD
mmetsp:Transcript_30649/g.99669  ORF Transcript_30649/g.99669 Transcript_30649/m.99669 type:complete len:682 (+) Transcript_30649:61-2106(+)